MKIFIHNVNTYTGSCLCETLNQVKNESIEIYGTVVEESKTKNKLKYKYENVQRIVSKTPKDNIVKHILRCDLVIFDLHNTDIEEIEYVIRKIKYEKLKRDITFVLISSVMTWNKTKRKFVKQKEVIHNGTISALSNGFIDTDKGTKENGGEINTTQQSSNFNMNKNHNVSDPDRSKIKEHFVNKEKIQTEGSSMNVRDEQRKEEKKMKYIQMPEIFTEKDYMKRIPSTQYEEYKSVETLVLSLNSKKKLNAYVVASGILYGNGENVFFPIFRNAWLSLDNHIIDKGNNFIPIIHVRGLCQFVKEIYIKQPLNKYIIAVDREHITQKTLIKTVSTFMSGNSTLLSVSAHDSIYFNHAEVLCVNLRFSCSELGGSKAEEDEAEVDEAEVDGEEEDRAEEDEAEVDEADEDEADEDEADEEEADEDEADEDEADEDKAEEDEAEEDEAEEDGVEEDDDASNKSDTSDREKVRSNRANNKKKSTRKSTKGERKGKKEFFKFHCCDGFTKNISILAKEFCKYRNLKQLKILILGQPGVGKTFIAKKICEYYNLNMCSISSLIEECKRNNYDFPQYYKQYLKDLSDEKQKNKNKDKNKDINKDKNKDINKDKNKDINKDKNKNKKNTNEINNKLALPDLASIFYEKLKSNECKFRGFVLDFFPRNYDEAEFFFDQCGTNQGVFLDDGKVNAKRLEDDPSSGADANQMGKQLHMDTSEEEGEEDNGEGEEDNDEGEEDDDKGEEDDEKIEEDDEKREEDDDEEEEKNKQPETSSDSPDSDITKRGRKKTKKERNATGSTKIGGKQEKREKGNNNLIFFPEFVIVLKSSVELCRSRMMNLPDEEVIKGHNDESGFERRNKKYMKENCRNDCLEFDQKKSIEDYFLERNVEVFSVHIHENSVLEDILTNIYIYIEKNIKFYNFLPSFEEKIKEKLHMQQKELTNEKEKIKNTENKLIAEEISENDELIRAQKKRQELLLKHQQQYFQNQSIPLRFYLIKNILPILTDALIHICRTKPKNPCLHIAQYLLENAHKYNVDEVGLDMLVSDKNQMETQHEDSGSMTAPWQGQSRE
ncbi:hypothetical protein, conserved [Plasmodium gonderi]|uniref:P-loop containing nucleoside triphosphate hydrolase n=1 Tax=Plasmodium gonderi TaxID=77519 RepID=A0A1Y1JET5_PLAGO|nr:hypothetical protein, conserved [Plasmodium gonderi]GAW80760.1 hypothetical protein, conserved [Plasmodium gonderi]